MAGVLNRTNLLDNELHFLLDLTYAGRTYRMSSRKLIVTKDDGTDLIYHPGISGLSFDDEVDLFSLSPKLISIPISIVLPDTDVASLVSKGYDLTTATGSLSLWISGTTYESRRILLRGTVKEPSYGASNEPLVFSLEQNPFEDRSLLIDPKANINSATWTLADDENYNVKELYPSIFGQPNDTSFYDAFSTPALVANITAAATDLVTLIVAGHPIEDGTVTVGLLEDIGVLAASFPSSLLTTTTRADGEGRVVSSVDFGYNKEDIGTRKFYVKWEGSAFGITNIPGEAMRGAGDILEYMLKRSTLDVDFARLQQAKQFLNKYLLDFYVDESVSYWDFIKSNILPILPISINVGPEGLYLVPWNFEPEDSDFVADIDIQIVKGERASAVQYEDPKELMNDITLEYSKVLPAAKHMRISNVHGDTTKVGASTGGSFMNKQCRLSHNRYGAKKKVLNTNIVFDAGTASSIVTWLSYANSLRTRTISYELDKSWAWLKSGDLIRLTDTDLSFADTKCFIEGIKHNEGPIVVVTFKIFDSMN